MSEEFPQKISELSPLDSGSAGEWIASIDLVPLIGHCCTVPDGKTIEQVYEEFQHHEHEFMAVVDDGWKALGICSREEVGMLLGLRFGWELYARAKIGDHLSAHATLVTVGEPVTSVLERALSRGDQFFFDDVVLVDPGGVCRGLIPMKTLIQLQHRFLSDTITWLDRQRREIETRQRRMEEDLELAGRLQQTMFRHQSYPFQDDGADGPTPCRLYFHYRPTSQVGGDFLQTLTLPGGQVGVLLCDVMGHGVRSALVTAMVRAMAETHIRSAGDPGEFLTLLNRDLSVILGQSDGQLFVTALFLLIDVGGEVHHAVAGHHDPLHLRKQEGDIRPLAAAPGTDGPPLGVIADFAYGTTVSPLASNDLILLYTDGVFEVFSPEGEEFGQDRLRAALYELRELAIPDLFDGIMARLSHFSGTAVFPDDICMIGIEAK
ncbi:MAG: hypothetical protein ED859_11530 [Desulfuromonadales bacterium]|nr:MAG: hypothetical protein ED859_11530 [Desulfuromonadales bacterium]